MRVRNEPVYVVIDGMSLFFSLVVDMLRKGVFYIFSYEEVRMEMFKFMDYLNAKNIVVKCVCIDSLFDPDKFDEYGRRVYERGQNMQRAWNSYFQYRRISSRHG